MIYLSHFEFPVPELEEDFIFNKSIPAMIPTIHFKYYQNIVFE